LKGLETTNSQLIAIHFTEEEETGEAEGLVLVMSTPYLNIVFDGKYVNVVLE
jgi:hypothetical protein